MLQKEGKLSLDDPIRKYIPEMPAYADKITLRRALSQTSGLRDLYVMMGQTGRTFAGDTIDALRVITHSAEPNYEPGARYLYTNSGWILAAQIVYRLTGKTLAQFAEERIFGPLGMHDTRYLADVATIIPNLAPRDTPRRPGGGFRVARSTYDGAIMGAGAVHTTVEDFGRWLEQLRRGDRRRARHHRDDDDADEAERRLAGDVGTEPGVRDRAHRRNAARTARRRARRKLGGLSRTLPPLPRPALRRRDVLQPDDVRPGLARAQGRRDLPRRPDAAGQRDDVDRGAGRRAARPRCRRRTSARSRACGATSSVARCDARDSSATRSSR